MKPKSDPTQKMATTRSIMDCRMHVLRRYLDLVDLVEPDGNESKEERKQERKEERMLSKQELKLQLIRSFAEHDAKTRQ